MKGGSRRAGKGCGKVLSGGIQVLNLWIERKCGNVSPLHLFQFCFSCVVDGDVIFFSFALLFFIVHTDMNFLPPTDMCFLPPTDFFVVVRQARALDCLVSTNERIVQVV